MKCKNCNGQKLVWCSRCQGSGIEKQWFLIMLICLIAIAVFSCVEKVIYKKPFVIIYKDINGFSGYAKYRYQDANGNEKSIYETRDKYSIGDTIK